MPLTTPCAAWREGDDWCAGFRPVETLLVQDPESLAALPALVSTRLASAPGLIAVGLLSYDAGHALVGMTTRNDYRPPLAAIHIFHADELVRSGSCDELALVAGETFTLHTAFSSDTSFPAYQQNFSRIHHYQRAGDCYQVNYTRRFTGSFGGDPFDGWLRLCRAHQSPHASYFRVGDSAIFGVSPERFIRILGRHLTTEPIKGSRPRGTTPDADQALADELVGSKKDRAENLMIVDLLRNDMGKVCTPGSISAERLFELRRFSNVQHLVSTVTGTLRGDVGPLDALLHCFPGGSITGAPKKRAMEIIAELEPHPRGFYCGSQFVLDSAGNLDSNILIRTFQTDGDRIYCHGGGGIVIDSDPDQEFAESEFKIRALMNALV